MWMWHCMVWGEWMVNQRCSGAVGALSELKAGGEGRGRSSNLSLTFEWVCESLGELWEKVQKVGHVCRCLDAWVWVGVSLEECWLGELELLSANGIPVTEASSYGLVFGGCCLLVQWWPNPSWAGKGFGVWKQIEIFQRDMGWETRDGLFLGIKDSSTNYASLPLFSAPKPANWTFRARFQECQVSL